MRDLFRRFSLVLFISILTGVALAAPKPVPAPPTLGAKSYILLDYHSGRVMAERDPDARMEPASITKLMTAYVVYKSLAEGDISLQDKVTVSKKAWQMEGSRMFIEVGRQVDVLDLLKGMIIQSGNDASVALAEHVAGTEEAFVGYMNHQAEVLGMTNTHFANATGMPHPDHYTTARDIALLMAAVIRDFPERYKLYAEKEFTYNGIRQYNRNKLLWRDSSVDGGKTGHTESAGYCLTASAHREGMRLISVVLGTDSERARAEQSQALLNYGFRFFETHELKQAGVPLLQGRIWKGETEELALGIEQPLVVTIPRGRYDALELSSDLVNPILAPVNAGDQLGTVRVMLEGEALAEVPLVALQTVPEGGLVSRAVDSLMLMVQ